MQKIKVIKHSASQLLSLLFGPLHMWKPLYPVCCPVKKKRKSRAAVSWRIRSVTRSLNGPLSVCTKRFCYCRTPGSVGPSTDTPSLSRWRGSKHKFSQEQINNTEAWGSVISVGDLSTHCKLSEAWCIHLSTPDYCNSNYDLHIRSTKLPLKRTETNNFK